MKNFDISIYGNVIVDTVYEVNSFDKNSSNIIEGKYTSLGAAANVIRELGNLNKNLNISVDSAIGNDSDGSFCKSWIRNFNKLHSSNIVSFIETTQEKTSNALIVSSLTDNTRTSAVNWGACQNHSKFTPHNSKWKHFMYVDKMFNLTKNDLKKTSNNSIISIDFCLGNHTKRERDRLLSLIEFVDYVFISEAEARSLTSLEKEYDMSLFLGKKSRGLCVLHTPKASYTSDGDFVSVFETDYIEDKELNVLGAGDVFCASFISKSINEQESELGDRIRFAHENTKRYLLKGK